MKPKPMTVAQLREVLKQMPQDYLALLNMSGEYLPIKSIATREVAEQDDDIFVDYDPDDEFQEHMEIHKSITLSDEEDQEY